MKTVNARLLCAAALLLPAAGTLAQGTPRLPVTDFAGHWGELVHEDSYERSGGPPLGDYQGLPLTEAGVYKADSHDHSEWSLPEFQCRPHSAPYQWRALGTIRFWNEYDPVGRDLRAIHIEYLRSLDRVIYMDGRDHPPANALHTWSGFSTGEFQGDTLVVTTTHIKGSYLRRNGASFTDKAVMTEFIDRHGDLLTVTAILDDVWLEEPLVQTTNYRYAPHTQLSFYPCTIADESISTEVPHFLPSMTEHLEDAAGWIPWVGTRGGAASTYPDFRLTLEEGGGAEPAPVPLPERRLGNADFIPPAEEDIGVLPVQGNVWMISGAGANIAVSVGREGILLVDTGAVEHQDATLRTVLELGSRVASPARPNDCYGLHCAESPYRWASPSLNTIIAEPEPPKPIRYIINTSAGPDHVGGNGTLAELSPDSPIVAVTFPPLNIPPAANVVAHENVLNRMLEMDGVPDVALPIEVFFRDRYDISQFVNGEAVRVFHVPNAHSDGDSFVHFRRSDVIAAGELVRADGYPVIRLDQGGSVDGLLAGLNLMLDEMVAEFRSQGGTLVIPARGRLMDTGDMGNYRNMVAIIRDRIQALVDQGMTLEQVREARPTRDYDAWYGSHEGDWTTDMFVEAVYNSLKEG